MLAYMYFHIKNGDLSRYLDAKKESCAVLRSAAIIVFKLCRGVWSDINCILIFDHTLTKTCCAAQIQSKRQYLHFGFAEQCDVKEIKSLKVDESISVG